MPGDPSSLGLRPSRSSPQGGGGATRPAKVRTPLPYGLRTGEVEPPRKARPGEGPPFAAEPAPPSVRRPGPSPLPLSRSGPSAKENPVLLRGGSLRLLPCGRGPHPCPSPVGRGVRAALLAGRDRDGVSSIRRAAALRPQARGAAAAAGSHHTIITPFRQKARRTVPLWRPMRIRGSARRHTPLGPAAGSAADRDTRVSSAWATPSAETSPISKTENSGV